MPLTNRSWRRKSQSQKTEEQKELEDGMTLISYLLAAMVSTLLWLAALVVSILRYKGV